VGVVQLRSRWLRFWFAPDLIQEQIAIATIVRSGFRGRVGVHDLPFAGAVGGLHDERLAHASVDCGDAGGCSVG
jgi:hypothetical protein